jgi:hypothetical protein
VHCERHRLHLPRLQEIRLLYRGDAPGREQQLAHIATASVNAMPPVRPNAMEIVADREVGRKQRGMVVAAQIDRFSALPGGYERAKSPSEAEVVAP